MSRNDMMLQLVRNIAHSLRSGSKETLLMRLVSTAKTEQDEYVISFLITHGYNQKVPKSYNDISDYTILMYAIEKRCSLSVVKLLAELCVDINAKPSYGYGPTALEMAICAEDREHYYAKKCVKILINAGADLCKSSVLFLFRSSSSEIPTFVYAITRRYAIYDVIDILISTGADINIFDIIAIESNLLLHMVKKYGSCLKYFMIDDMLTCIPKKHQNVIYTVETTTTYDLLIDACGNDYSDYQAENNKRQKNSACTIS